MWNMRFKCLCEPLGMGNLWGEDKLLREHGGWKRWRSTRSDFWPMIDHDKRRTEAGINPGSWTNPVVVFEVSKINFNSMTFNVTFWKCSKVKTKEFITRYLVSNISYFQPENWGRFPFWWAYFSNGLKNHQLDYLQRWQCTQQNCPATFPPRSEVSTLGKPAKSEYWIRARYEHPGHVFFLPVLRGTAGKWICLLFVRVFLHFEEVWFCHMHPHARFAIAQN